ncbi:MAG: hypothetical protein LIO72_03035 [Ruminococcus sp.]|nr:hypothetical protein [Ruminococcus sp.]
MARRLYTFDYDRYWFSEEATRLGKELVRKQKKRKYWLRRLRFILALGTVCISFILLLTTVVEIPKAVALIMIPVSYIFAAIVYNLVGKAQDNSMEDLIDIALKRDFKKIPENSEDYQLALTTMQFRQDRKEQKEAKSFKSRLNKIFKK